MSLISGGAWIKSWEVKNSPIYPEIGLLDWQTFEPEKWQGYYPYPAIEKMTQRGAFWGAKMVAAFTDRDIRTIVNEGSFSTPMVKEFLIQTLIKGRDRILNIGFDTNRIIPLDRFSI